MKTVGQCWGPIVLCYLPITVEFLADNEAYRWNVPSWAVEGRQHRFSFNSKCCFRQCLPRPVIQWWKQVKTVTLDSHQSSSEKTTFSLYAPLLFPTSTGEQEESSLQQNLLQHAYLTSTNSQRQGTCLILFSVMCVVACTCIQSLCFKNFQGDRKASLLERLEKM